MIHHNHYIIIDPYKDSEWFSQWPAGVDMQLKLMCKCQEGQVFFFPEDHDIRTSVDDRRGHPLVEYSPPYDCVEDAKKDIDSWAKSSRW